MRGRAPIAFCFVLLGAVACKRGGGGGGPEDALAAMCAANTPPVLRSDSVGATVHFDPTSQKFVFNRMQLFFDPDDFNASRGGQPIKQVSASPGPNGKVVVTVSDGCPGGTVSAEFPIAVMAGGQLAATREIRDPNTGIVTVEQIRIPAGMPNDRGVVILSPNTGQSCTSHCQMAGN